MQKRSLSIVLLVVAFLFSAWGNVVAAAFCPRYLSNRDCCVKQIVSKPSKVDSQASCHHQMAGMEMGEMQMEPETSPQLDPGAQSAASTFTSESANGQVAWSLPTEQCAHCWIHSRPTSGTSAIVALDPSRRLVDANSPPELAVIAHTVSLSSIRLSEHDPPGATLPRRILLNVFRI